MTIAFYSLLVLIVNLVLKSLKLNMVLKSVFPEDVSYLNSSLSEIILNLVLDDWIVQFSIYLCASGLHLRRECKSFLLDKCMLYYLFIYLVLFSYVHLF